MKEESLQKTIVPEVGELGEGDVDTDAELFHPYEVTDTQEDCDPTE